MSGEFEARSEKLPVGWNDDGVDSYSQIEIHNPGPELCHNCNYIIQELVQYVGKTGNEGDFTGETRHVQLARFKEDQRLKAEECRFCRVIHSCNPGWFTYEGPYPKLAFLNKRSDWGVEKVWKIEFAQTTAYSSAVGNLYMLPIPDDEPTTKCVTSWVPNGNSFECAKAWLDDCNRQHSCVSKNLKPFVPTRLISIGTSSDSPVRLELHSTIPPNSKYATLSHCWGDYKPIQLLISNLSSFLIAIDFTTLSKTFQEAIITARSLGLGYIWIDSLCIIQDSPSDWSTESICMNDVYANSHINIAAASAVDGRGGLFFPPTNCHEEDMRAEYNIDGNKFRIIDRDHWYNTIEQLPLLSRAWVYQERLLSPRNLYFAKNSIAWECDTCRLSETFPVRMPASEKGEIIKRFNHWLHGLSGEEEHAHKQWSHIVTAYSKANLTYPTDKLIALCGIATKFSIALSGSDVYLAGLWKNDLPNQLLWYVNPGSRLLHQPNQDGEYIAPSWSWASITSAISPIYFHSPPPPGHHTHTSKPLITIVSTPLSPGFSKLASVGGGSITLRAQIFKASLVYNTESLRCGCCDPQDFNTFTSFIHGTNLDTNDFNSPFRFYPDFSFSGCEAGTRVDDLYCVPVLEDLFKVPQQLSSLQKGGEKVGEQFKYWTWITGLVLVREEGAFKRWGTWKTTVADEIQEHSWWKEAFGDFDRGNEKEGLLFTKGKDDKMEYNIEII